MDVDKLPEEPVEETAENIEAIDNAISGDLDALDKLFESHIERTTANRLDEIPSEAVEVEETSDPELVGSVTVRYQPAQRSLEKA